MQNAVDLNNIKPVDGSWGDLEKLWFKVGYHTALDEPGKVIDLLQAILRLNPFDAAACLHLGVNLREQNDLESALAYLGCAVQLDEENADAAFQYGTCLAIAGDNEKALPWLIRSVNDSPQSVTCLVNLGMNYLALNDEENAMDCFEDVLSLSPDNLPALYNLGFYHKKNQNFDLARDLFIKLASTDPCCVRAYQMLMRVFLQLNNTYEAINTIESALARNPHELELILDKLALQAIFSDQAQIPEEIAKIEKLVPDCSIQLAERIKTLNSEHLSRYGSVQ